VSTWKAPGAAPIDFAGKKVGAALIVDDENLRVSAEEALARELDARGSIGVPAYRVVPREELRNKDAAKGFFERAGIAGLVVLRLVGTETTSTDSPVVWSSGYYAHPWDYWGASWTQPYSIGGGGQHTTITVEVLLYDLARDAPIWAAVTRSKDPKDVQTYMKKLAADVGKRLEKDHLVRRTAR
jgi:hypothetical protein